MTAMQSVTVLGSTGSIGVNTLNVIASHPGRFSVFALSANDNVDMLLGQCLEFDPVYAVMNDEDAASALIRQLRGHDCRTEVMTGMRGLEFIAGDAGADCVVAAIVGGAGLMPTFTAVRAGKKVLLANKEALVMAGNIFMDTVAETGAVLLPIDSEHNAMFQCLPVNARARFENRQRDGFRKIVLTASGGPFLHTPVESLAAVTPDQACAHPNWRMGPKISVDSATMVNKALELIEACFLFGIDESRIDILIHPQSIIHSMVHYCDGSVLAQLGNPDMRTPIAFCLAWPDRTDSGVEPLDMAAVSQLDFLPPDLERFPCLKLGREAARQRGTAPVILNAANELAVAAFLDHRLRFDQIPAIIDAALQRQPVCRSKTLEDVLEEDRKARELAAALIADLQG